MHTQSTCVGQEDVSFGQTRGAESRHTVDCFMDLNEAVDGINRANVLLAFDGARWAMSLTRLGFVDKRSSGLAKWHKKEDQTLNNRRRYRRSAQMNGCSLARVTLTCWRRGVFQTPRIGHSATSDSDTNEMNGREADYCLFCLMTNR